MAATGKPPDSNRIISNPINKDNPYIHKTTVADSERRFIIITGTIGKHICPNKCPPLFFNSLFAEISKFQESRDIIGGDFNLVLNPHMDRFILPKSYEPHHKSYSRIDLFLVNNSILHRTNNTQPSGSA